MNIIAQAHPGTVEVTQGTEIPHGTASGYTHHGCRCAPCTEAVRLAVAAWRARQKRLGERGRKARASMAVMRAARRAEATITPC
jgi:hypothetical protein